MLKLERAKASWKHKRFGSSVSSTSSTRGFSSSATAATTMARPAQIFLFSFFFCVSFNLLLSHTAKADDAEDQLFRGINDYRASLKLPALTQNKNAECLAEQIADQFENQPCTNSTGANTVPGTETQLPNYPKYLDKCHLNATNTRDGMVMPACVPKLDSSLVLTNFTKSQYSQYLNDSQYTGAGIADKDDWIVVVLSTSTPNGNYAPATSASTNSAAALVPKFVGFHSHLLLLFLSLLMLAMPW